MKKHFLILLVALSAVFNGIASEIQITEKPLDHSELVTYNFDLAKYQVYQRAFHDSLLSFFADWEIGQDIKIIQSLDPDLTPYYGFSAKPILADSSKHALQKILMHIKPITSNYLPFATEFTLTINGGCKERGLAYSPILKTPFEMRQGAYEFGNMDETLSLIQRWVNQGGLAVVAEILRDKSERFANINPRVYHPEAPDKTKHLFADFDSDGSLHWSTIESYRDSPQLMQVLKCMLLVREGQLAYADIYKQMIYQFEPPETLLRYLLDELTWRMTYYFLKEDAKIKQATVLLTSAREKEGYTILDTMISKNRMCTFALYFRLNQSVPPLLSTYSQRDVLAMFKSSNPMRSLILTSYSKEEAYANALRKSTLDFFIDAETFNEDFPKYAEIALELNVYDFAADLYWMLYMQEILNFPIEECDADDPVYEPSQACLFYKFRYDFALFKLGIERPHDRRTKKKYKRLDKKFRKRMKRNAAYKNFNY